MSKINADTMVLVENVAGHRVGYTLPEHKIKKTWEKDAEKKVKMWELEELKFEPGGQTLLNDYLKVINIEHREHLDLPLIEEYLFTSKEMRDMLTNRREYLMEVMSWLSDGNKQLLVDLAIEIEVDSSKIIEGIKKYCGVDITKALQLKKEEREDSNGGEAAASKKAETTQPKTREEILAQKSEEVKAKKYEILEEE